MHCGGGGGCICWELNLWIPYPWIQGDACIGLQYTSVATSLWKCTSRLFLHHWSVVAGSLAWIHRTCLSCHKITRNMRNCMIGSMEVTLDSVPKKSFIITTHPVLRHIAVLCFLFGRDCWMPCSELKGTILPKLVSSPLNLFCPVEGSVAHPQEPRQPRQCNWVQSCQYETH